MNQSLPKILILGRPNVGKSTLINRIIGRNTAITYDEPGVTRDLSEHLAVWNGKPFLILDSAGVMFDKSDDIYLQTAIEDKIVPLLDKVHKIIFLTDSRDGVHAMDKAIANKLREYKYKVLLAVNKVDNEEQKSLVPEFYTLGLGEPYSISSIHGVGTGDLLDSATDILEKGDKSESDSEGVFRIALIGRPNVGKSSLINAFINEDRLLVDNQAGTTRDSVDVFFKTQGNRYIFMDTAGLRRQSKVKDSIEFYSTTRTKKAIKRADLVVFVTETEEFLCDQDRRLMNLVLAENRNMIVLVNKWDLTGRTADEQLGFIKMAHRYMPPLKHYPIMVGSAIEKVNFGKLFQLIPQVIDNGRRRISTSVLNNFVHDVLRVNPPASKQGKAVKVYYGTQADCVPPTFIFFANSAALVQDDYKRFLEKRIRTELDPFLGVPIQIFFKSSHVSRK